MERLYHLIRQPVELKAGREFSPESLKIEGFVHLCMEAQIGWVANTFMGDAGVLWLMELDPAILNAEIKNEDAGTYGKFPHLYGPIPHEAVCRQMPLVRDAALKWGAPPQLATPPEEPFKKLP